MTLIEQLKEDVDIQPYIVPKCEENEICVELDEDIQEDTILIIKVDSYYNAQHMSDTPRSIDCLIIQYCGENTYKLYLIELKNHKVASSIRIKKLEEKFHTTLYDFMSNRFRKYFYNTDFVFKKIHLVLSAARIEKDKYIRNHNLDFLMSMKPFRFDNKRLWVDGIPPNPIVRKCMEGA